MMGNATPRTLVIVRESLIEPVESSRRLHEAIKERMRQRNPSLKIQLSHKEVVKLMDELSEKVARGMPFATWQETEAFMRGEDRYDFERQQYLHH
ncbi:MAG: hypothetical protein U9M97_05075 [Candidatus Hadarchaeota archaeon]|nr:hypothetical protein [Candidatus Hadarchaeota archaeon]